MVFSRATTDVSSMKQPISPVSEKSSSVVSSVSEATSSSPRAFITASAEEMMVPPTQKPSALTWSTLQISCATLKAASTPCSM